MCGSREEKRWKKQWKEKERVGWHMNKWEIWDSQGYVSYKPQESGRERERRVKKKGNRQHNGLPWRGGGGGYQASQSQTAEVRVSLRHQNPVYECHTNRQAAHGRPKSLILPEALMFNQSQEGIQHLQYISTDSNPMLRFVKLAFEHFISWQQFMTDSELDGFLFNTKDLLMAILRTEVKRLQIYLGVKDSVSLLCLCHIIQTWT